MKEYKFNGNVQYFVGIMKWSLVVHQMQEDGRTDLYDVMTKPDKIEEVAKEYGINTITLLKELVRFGKEAKDVLNFYDNLTLTSKKEKKEQN